MTFAEAQNLAPIATERNLSQLFSEQARLNSAKIALIAGEEKFSYQDLDQRANQLASFLLSQGVGPEALVGVLLDRKPQMLIALLAVLKAGAAYVPLDPAYPAERIGYIVAGRRNIHSPELKTSAARCHWSSRVHSVRRPRRGRRSRIAGSLVPGRS